MPLLTIFSIHSHKKYSLTLCWVGVNLGRMENIGRKIKWKTMLSIVWQTRENRDEGKPRRKFSLPGPQIFSSQIGRKSLKRKCSLSTFTIMPSEIKFFFLKKKAKKRKSKTGPSKPRWEEDMQWCFLNALE